MSTRSRCVPRLPSSDDTASAPATAAACTTSAAAATAATAAASAVTLARLPAGVPCLVVFTVTGLGHRDREHGRSEDHQNDYQGDHYDTPFRPARSSPPARRRADCQPMMSRARHLGDGLVAQCRVSLHDSQIRPIDGSGTRQPVGHQGHRIIDRSIPRPIEDAIRFLSVAIAWSQRGPDPVSERSTSLRCEAEADVSGKTPFVVPGLDPHELIDLAPLEAT